jgi:hypothetical protein
MKKEGDRLRRFTPALSCGFREHLSGPTIAQKPAKPAEIVAVLSA